MSDNTVSVETQPPSTSLRVVTSHFNNRMKQYKTIVPNENFESSSQNLQTNLVQDSHGFAESSTTGTVDMNEAQVIESSNHVILGQDDRVMYISTENDVVFNPKEMASASTEHMPLTLNSRPENSVSLDHASSLNSNYLVVVENSRAAQQLPSDFSTPVVLSSETSSLAPACSDGNSLKPGDSEHAHQQTIMVLDGQIQPDGILIDPSVLVTYDSTSGGQMTFSTDPTLDDAVHTLTELSQGPLIHLEQAPSADGTENYLQEKSVLQKPISSQSFNLDNKTVAAQNPESTDRDLTRKDLYFDRDSTNKQKDLKLKEDLKLLEKYHLQHHMKEAKKKICNQDKTCAFSTSEKSGRNEMKEEISSKKPDNSLDLLSKDDNKEIPVFSNITAKINADLLTLIPGCQRFLLEKMKKSPLSSQIHMSFESDVECTFSGSLKALMEIHNSLKKLLDIENVSLLGFQSSQKTNDRSVMCSLLQPFVSSRGRQPKYSYKAKALGFTSDFEALLNVDNDEDDDDDDDKPPPLPSRNRKRKRGRPRKVLKKGIESKQSSHLPEFVDRDLSYFEKSQHELSEVESSERYMPSMRDQLQRRLMEEEIESQRNLEGKINTTTLGEDIGQDQFESTERRHLNEENRAGKFSCTHCSFTTQRQSHLLIHMRCHKDGSEKTYHCKKCDFVSMSLSYLKRHEMKHKENLYRLENTRNKMVYSCPECKRTLRSKMHLHRHMRDVHGPDIRPYLCDMCGKAFKRTDALKQHKALHESKANRILPHKCSTCGKAFRSLAHLKEHMVIHTSERPYLCHYCGAAFKTQAVQKRHILTLHIKPRAHVCSICCRQFNTKHALQRHENTHMKSETPGEAAVLVINPLEEAPSSFDEKEKRAAVSNIEAQVAGVTVVMKDEEEAGAQASNALVQDIIGTASAQAVIEDQIEAVNEGIQQAYIQGNQDATTLYYFTGDLNSL
ncbi:zinc finger protein [Elysia marginata]|uniref:Zinc finger protein n=1 Tax=Elysia marginata TaxID=1093978 RepID=A0AAV4HLA1_9GAST|nr:zinc finger protein [Elysia marginata]